MIKYSISPTNRGFTSTCSDYRPATRYYHISLAMPDDTQQDVVRRLSQSRPKILVFSDDRLGLPVWDHIPSMVRHYEVSQYILDHYKPLGVVDGQVLFAAVDADVPQISTLGIAPAEALVTDNVYFHIAQCDWGYAPNFLSVSPSQSEESSALNVPLRDAAGSTLPASTKSSIQISLPAGEEWTKYRWLEIDAPSGFHGDHWALSDTGRTDPLRQVSFDTLDDSPHRIRVRVGSCAQWHGYKSAALLLQHSQAQEVSAVRLIPMDLRQTSAQYWTSHHAKLLRISHLVGRQTDLPPITSSVRGHGQRRS